MKKTLQILLLTFLLPWIAQAQVRINEVGYAGVDVQGTAKWVELFNAGGTPVDVSSYFLCNFPAYSQISSLTVLSGNTTIPAGGYLVVAFNAVGAGDGEVGLYSTGTFASSDAMVDYMQYGSAGHTRESVAVGAGVWTAGAFVTAAPSGQSLAFTGTGATPAERWAAATSTPGASNDASGVAIERLDETTPTSFTLHGNYPNPFNPTTTIRYDLARAGQVELSVYNLLGERMASLVQGEQAAGAYEVDWDGRDAHGQFVPSGVYIYRIQFENETTRSRAMTLLK